MVKGVAEEVVDRGEVHGGEGMGCPLGYGCCRMVERYESKVESAGRRVCVTTREGGGAYVCGVSTRCATSFLLAFLDRLRRRYHDQGRGQSLLQAVFENMSLIHAPTGLFREFLPSRLELKVGLRSCLPMHTCRQNRFDFLW